MKNLLNLKKYYLEFEEDLLKLRKNDDINDLINMYRKLKILTPLFYKRGKVGHYYNKILLTVMKAENFFSDTYLINEKIDINKNIRFSNDLSEEELVEYLVLNTRKYLQKFNRSLDINALSFENTCNYASLKTQELCEDHNIDSDIIIISPGYSSDDDLFSGSNFHCFNILKINNEKYLIDCTYKQFFKNGKVNLERLGIINLSPPRVGAYMMMDEKRKALAHKLLKDGYIKIDDDTLKDYLDGFTMSFRNGLYYEKTKDFSYTTNYTSKDYENFLNGLDSQINYEDIKMLGFQREPLNNYDMSFEKR